MTKEEKELLLKDLCARLPYGVSGCFYESSEDKNINAVISGLTHVGNSWWVNIYGSSIEIDRIKPYLFPLSSMTKEQYKEWCDLEAEPLEEILGRNKMSTLEHHLLIAKSLTDSVNYCYKNHFDVYGLIPKGLANDATGLNIY